MRIAVVSSNFIRIPPDPSVVPKGYSGAPESITSALVESLVSRGHEVTLFGSGDSRTNATLVSVTPSGTSMNPDISPGHRIDYEFLLLSKCYEMAGMGMYDIVHSMVDLRSAMVASFCSVPTVTTLHSPLSGIRKDILSRFPKSQWYVSISDAQRIPLPGLRYAQTVYHGIDAKTYTLGDGGGGYMLMAGRMREEKGVEPAVQAALKSNIPLHLVGEPTSDDEFWKTSIVPFIDGKQIFQEGYISKEKLVHYYQKATALLFPIQWEEPFGLVMIEAMACGTPVIAYNRGSVAEVIKDGETGFIIDPDNADRPGKGTWKVKKQGVDGLVEALGRIQEINRQTCRRHAEQNFTIETMVSGYESVYRTILSGK